MRTSAQMAHGSHGAGNLGGLQPIGLSRPRYATKGSKRTASAASPPNRFGVSEELLSLTVIHDPRSQCAPRWRTDASIARQGSLPRSERRPREPRQRRRRKPPTPIASRSDRRASESATVHMAPSLSGRGTGRPGSGAGTLSQPMPRASRSCDGSCPQDRSSSVEQGPSTGTRTQALT
jgi:hypothetical protein